MAGTLEKGLLSEGHNAPHRRVRKVAIAATVAGVLLSASMVAYSVGKESANQSAMVGLSADAPKRDPWCYGYTGGTCTELACNKERGAICTSWGRCECASGCVGADGNCYHDIVNYTTIATKVKFDSKKYPGNFMHLQAASIWNMWNQVRFSDAASWTWSGQQYFDIYELPGRGNSGEKRYFISSEKWPRWVASIVGAGMKGRAHAFGLYDKNLDWMQMPWRPWKVTLSMCRLPDEPDVVKIGRPVLQGDHWEWADVHELSEFVDTWETPGVGANWNVVDQFNMPVQLNDLDKCVIPA